MTNEFVNNSNKCDRAQAISRREILVTVMSAAVSFVAGASKTHAVSGRHVALLGDSIFDNKSYVGTGPDVVAQLRERLPEGWQATLLAKDGDVTSDVVAQLRALPPDTSHLIVSAGGNDALKASSILESPAKTVAEALYRLSDVREKFENDYNAMVEALLSHNLPTALCTIYDARYPDLRKRRTASAGITIFNDCITRKAFANGMALIDLRQIFNGDHDYANPIEPSVIGGAKLTQVIADYVAVQSNPGARSVVFGR